METAREGVGRDDGADVRAARCNGEDQAVDERHARDERRPLEHGLVDAAAAVERLDGELDGGVRAERAERTEGGRVDGEADAEEGEVVLRAEQVESRGVDADGEGEREVGARREGQPGEGDAAERLQGVQEEDGVVEGDGRAADGRGEEPRDKLVEVEGDARRRDQGLPNSSFEHFYFCGSATLGNGRWFTELGNGNHQRMVN